MHTDIRPAHPSRIFSASCTMPSDLALHVVVSLSLRSAGIGVGMACLVGNHYMGVPPGGVGVRERVEIDTPLACVMNHLCLCFCLHPTHLEQPPEGRSADDTMPVRVADGERRGVVEVAAGDRPLEHLILSN